MKLFVDLDGVLADFDTQYHAEFGVRPDKMLDNVDWGKVASVKDFYLGIPPMADMQVLWNYIDRYRPIILTGVPYSVNEAPDNKRAWVRAHVGADIEVICCASRNKCLHAAPGDVLIDDWEKYRDLWVGKGGRFVTHRSADETIKQLSEIGV